MRDGDAAVRFKAVSDRHRLHDTTAVPQANDHQGACAIGRLDLDMGTMKQRNYEHKFERYVLLPQVGVLGNARRGKETSACSHSMSFM